jgi:hypothetical protein
LTRTKYALIADVLASFFPIQLHNEIIDWKIENILLASNIFTEVASRSLHIDCKCLLLQSSGNLLQSLEAFIIPISGILPINDDFPSSHPVQRITNDLNNLSSISTELLIVLRPPEYLHESMLPLAISVEVIHMGVRKHIQSIH